MHYIIPSQKNAEMLAAVEENLRSLIINVAISRKRGDKFTTGVTFFEFIALAQLKH